VDTVGLPPTILTVRRSAEQSGNDGNALSGVNPMAMTKLKLMPLEHVAVKEIISMFPDFIVQFDNFTQCLVTTSKTHGQKRLYPFSKDIVGQWPWVVPHGDDLIIVANRLVFQVAYEEHVMPGVSTLFCIYRGMVS
jgi:hypothetical protein